MIKGLMQHIRSIVGDTTVDPEEAVTLEKLIRAMHRRARETGNAQQEFLANSIDACEMDNRRIAMSKMLDSVCALIGKEPEELLESGEFLDGFTKGFMEIYGETIKPAERNLPH
jgi:hypothetical protein